MNIAKSKETRHYEEMEYLLKAWVFIRSILGSKPEKGVNLRAGDGGKTGKGGDFIMRAGDGGAKGNGGNIDITA